MRIFCSYVALFCAMLLLTGFSWSFGGDNCKEAMDLLKKIDTTPDETQLRQLEGKILSICPDGAAGHFVTALQYERAGNLDGAIAEYRKALQLERFFPEASGNLGLLYVKKGLNDDASVELARGLSSIPNPKYHWAMGKILAERKVYPLAFYHYGEASLKLSRDPLLFMDLAELYNATGQTDKALEEYRRVLTIDAGMVKAYIGRGAVFIGKNELDKATDELKKAALIEPHNKEVHLMLADIYEKKGDSKQAEYEYLLGGRVKGKDKIHANIQAPQQSPPMSRVEPAMSGDINKTVENLKLSLKERPDAGKYEELGNYYRSAGKDSDAMAAYQEAAYMKSSSSDLYLNMGILNEKNSQPDEAAVAYRRAIKAKPDNADAHLRLANIYLERGSQQQAVEQFGEFLKLRPDSPDIQLKLARIFARNKEVNLAIEGYLAVLKHSPDNIDANREIAALYKSKGIDDKAEDHYKKVLAQQKEDMETRNGLVGIYVKSKKYEEITELLKGAVELFPDDPNNHYKLGLIYDFRKEYDNAISSYKKALELKPDHSRSMNALGRLYMKIGRLTEAKEVLEAAKKADPSMQETSVLLSNIRDEFNPEPRKISKGKKGKLKKVKKKPVKGKKKVVPAKKTAPQDKAKIKKTQQ
jgi:tetratricopeptide (TPR) repeat protein